MQYYDRTATHLILKNSTATNSESYQGVQTFRCNIQPANGETSILVNGQYGRTFTGFTTYSGLQVNDAVTISGSTTVSGMFARVRAVSTYNYGPLQHVEFVVVVPEA